MKFIEGEVNTLDFPDNFFDDYKTPTLWSRGGVVHKQVSSQYSTHWFSKMQHQSLILEDMVEPVRDAFGEKVYFHVHAYFEINYVVQGNVFYIFDGQLIHAGAGDLIAVNGDVPHAWIPDKQTETAVAKVLVFMPTILLDTTISRDETLHHFCRSFTWSHLTPDNPIVGKILKELSNIQTELDNKKAGYTDMILTHIIGAAVWLMRQTAQEKQELVTKPQDSFYQIIEYIQKHITDRLSLTNVARIANMNPNYFCTYFKKKMGLSFGEYLRQLRLSKAVNYLLNSDRSIAEIINLSGFTSRTQFYRVFQNAYHMFPLEMRQQAQQQKQVPLQLNEFEEVV